MTELYIKNMVCPRCVMAVRELLANHGLTAIDVVLGMAQVAEELTTEQTDRLRIGLQALGFDLLDNPQLQLVEQIRTSVIEWVRQDSEREKLSAFVQGRIAKDYSLLSKLFSETAGMTIERYCILQRVEYAKELLCYSELTNAEIAFQSGYASPAHFSSQFRQETGMTPTQFRQQSGNRSLTLRRSLDEI